MCMSITEMNEAMEQIKEWKLLKEQAEDNISALNMKVIEFLNETEECEAFDKKGHQCCKYPPEHPLPPPLPGRLKHEHRGSNGSIQGFHPAKHGDTDPGIGSRGRLLA